MDGIPGYMKNLFEFERIKDAMKLNQVPHILLSLSLIFGFPICTLILTDGMGFKLQKKLWKFQFQLQCQLIGFVLFKLNIHTYYVLRRYVCIITNVTMYAQELRGKKYLFRKNDNVKAKQIETITKRESTEKLAQPPAI